MTPTEFTLWLNGASEIVGDEPPTPAQWAAMREKLGITVGKIVASRLLEQAEEAIKLRDRLDLYKDKVSQHQQQVDLADQHIRAITGISAGAMFVGTPTGYGYSGNSK